MNIYIKDPGGWRVISDPGGAGGSPLSYDPSGGGAGYEKGPRGGMGMYDPGAGGGYMKDPGTGI
ncbi:hypothetical protein CON07_20100 [Bacillus sp. AFS094611]|uniref:hypothetical protein n=1 Tax=Bacillus sp. AFS094611 TaxID=2033516 RepID=UPI000BEE1684|nr:hypothetical protein [Bacillus sp. AFS094611]PDZ49771.1 hypothetical protein CON07_20100 [Bacillus sp. AFS094611]